MALRDKGGQNPLTTEDGFAEFYSANSRKLLVFFAQRVLDADTAMDLTAETFAQVLISRSRFRGRSSDEASAWVFGIARNKLRRYFRRGRAERSALDRLRIEPPEPSPIEIDRIEELAGLERLRRVTAEGLTRLSNDQRDALRLRIVEELPYSEVAQELKISEQTARARVSRGLRALAEHLDLPTPSKETAG